MATVASFLKHLSLSPNKSDNEGLFLINFFKYSGFGSGQLLGRTNFDLLVSTIQQNSYWDQKKEHLLKIFLDEVKSFLTQEKLDIDLVRFKELISKQVIEVEKPLELLTIVSRKIKKKLTADQKVKLKVLPSGEIMCLVMDEKQNLEVSVFSSRVTLSKGLLSPLLPKTQLYYNSNMDLKRGLFQRLQTDSHTYNFVLTQNGLKGCALSGSFLQLKEKMLGELKSDLPVFFPLKNIEGHFIDLSSDPFYLELCNGLDRSITMLKRRESGAYSLAKKALKSTYLALKYVFEDDKHLKSKLLQLEHTIQAEYQCAEQARNLLD